MGTWPQSVSGGNGDSLQNVGFAGITFGRKISITTNGGKVLLYSQQVPCIPSSQRRGHTPLHSAASSTILT